MDITADPDDGLRLLSSDEQLAIEQGTSTLDTKSEDEGGNNLKKRYLSCKEVADELLEHYSVRAIHRFEDAWNAAALSAYKHRDMLLQIKDKDDIRQQLLQCVHTADKLIRQACKACGVKEDDIAEQLHHIKWPQIDASADLVTFDATLAVVTWLAKHTEFKMKKKDAKRKEPRHNNCPAFYHTEDNGNRTIRYLTQSECLSTMADPHKNPGVLEIPPEDAAQVFTTRKGYTTCISHKKNPLGYVNNFQLSDKVALNCGCSISSGLLELWLEKTAAAAGVPIVEAGVFELCGLQAEELFTSKEDRLIRTVEWGLLKLTNMFGLRPGEEELEGTWAMFEKALRVIRSE
ncbi:hypothetical protein BDN71DRAFT_1514551 [Pleurotus eryngii]|uniref:Uncharacterized protein n=1 Tax=Pleurotus eryngii TaxID=5323 RepID=A0A9P5ZGU3_PLEER|nr:hypothetical protein BDN71DRAFT_1514551 [Pleurotus eryngii]